MAVEDGRQVATKIEDIRDDHIQRYKFAADVFATMEVIDAACGVGYGSKILTSRGCKVHAYDLAPEAIAHLRWHFRDENIEANVGDITKTVFPKVDAAISFETIEHLKHPEVFLTNLKQSCGLLIGSVPNQEVLPFDPERHLYHEKHYTYQELAFLLTSTGWNLLYCWSQQGKEGEDALVTRNPIGQTIIFGASANNSIFPRVSI